MCLPTCANKKTYHKSYIIWTMSLSDMVFNVRPPRSSHWLYLIVLLQTSECHHPKLPPTKSAQMCPANCFGPTKSTRFQWIFSSNQWLLWGLRYPFTNDIDGSSRSHSAVPTVLVIDSLMATKISNASLIPQGKRVKHWDRKESHTLPETNIASEKWWLEDYTFLLGR